MDEKVEKLLTQTADLAFDIADKISAHEKDCLLKILWRFGIKKIVLTDFNKVIRKDFAGRNNYWEYYYPMSKEPDYFLMNRELVVTVINDVPDIKLNVNFNPELVVNNEL